MLSSLQFYFQCFWQAVFHYSSFTCDSSGVVYVLGCRVYGKQYVCSTFTSVRTRFINYKSLSRKFSSGMSVVLADHFTNFTEVNHNGFLDVTDKSIDRVLGESRLWEGCWQFTLNSFTPEGLSIRFEDH